MTNSRRNVQHFVHVILVILHCFNAGLCTEVDSINSTQSLRDPGILSSPGGIFKLGFFSPLNSTNRYVGIWYNFSVTTVIWVANRDKPLRDSSGVVKISRDGNAVLTNGEEEILWSSNVSTSQVDSIALLQDSGNFVIVDHVNNKSTIWQSFEHPSDTVVPKMRISENTRTGERGKGRSKILEKPAGFVMDWKGNMVQSYWDENETNWKITWSVPKNDCDVYGTCGPFGSCNYFESPICSCLKGLIQNIGKNGKRGIELVVVLGGDLCYVK